MAWEYKTLVFGPNSAYDAHPSTIREQLNQEGAVGWEMIGTDRFGADIVFYLKRVRGGIQVKDGQMALPSTQRTVGAVPKPAGPRR